MDCEYLPDAIERVWEMLSAGCASQFVGQKSRKMGRAVCRNDFWGTFRNMFEKYS